jgi:hypothetical protein
LGSTELRRLLATWGMDSKAIARYDAKHGFEHTPLTVAPPVKKQTTTAPVKKTAIKTKTVIKRQKHTGANGEIKYVRHRDLYIGFWDNRVVVTKRTKEACKEFLKANFKAD